MLLFMQEWPNKKTKDVASSPLEREINDLNEIVKYDNFDHEKNHQFDPEVLRRIVDLPDDSPEKSKIIISYYHNFDRYLSDCKVERELQKDPGDENEIKKIKTDFLEAKEKKETIFEPNQLIKMQRLEYDKRVKKNNAIIKQTFEIIKNQETESANFQNFFRYLMEIARKSEKENPITQEIIDYTIELYGTEKLDWLRNTYALIILRKNPVYSAEMLLKKVEGKEYVKEITKVATLTACDLIGFEAVKERISSFALEDQKKEIDFLYAILKISREKKHEIDFETMTKINIEINEIGEDLTPEDKEKILEIATENYSEIEEYKNNPEELKAVLEELEKELSTEEIKKQRKYILKYKGQLIAFCRFKPIEEPKTDVYGGSLHVSKELQDLCIGKYFIQKALEKESENHNIHGLCRTELFQQFYEKFGFKIIGAEEENGVKYYKILKPKKEIATKE